MTAHLHPTERKSPAHVPLHPAGSTVHPDAPGSNPIHQDKNKHMYCLFISNNVFVFDCIPQKDFVDMKLLWHYHDTLKIKACIFNKVSCHKAVRYVKLKKVITHYVKIKH